MGEEVGGVVEEEDEEDVDHEQFHNGIEKILWLSLDLWKEFNDSAQGSSIYRLFSAQKIAEFSVFAFLNVIRQNHIDE